MAVEQVSRVHAMGFVIPAVAEGPVASVKGQGFSAIVQDSTGDWTLTLDQPLAPDERLTVITPRQRASAANSTVFAAEFVDTDESAEVQSSVVHVHIENDASADADSEFCIVVYALPPEIESIDAAS